MLVRLPKVGLIVTTLLLGALASGSGSAQEFFNPNFSIYAREPAPSVSAFAPFDPSMPSTRITVRPRFGAGAGGSVTYCVRTCDGRYFPVAGRGDESHANVCSNFCPAAEIKIYSGSSIDDAQTAEGKPYSKSATAFRYRNEIVPDCSCNGGSTFGLSYMRVEDDPTIRSGDIVAKPEGLMIAASSNRRRSGIMFRPLSASSARAYGLATRPAGPSAPLSRARAELRADHVQSARQICDPAEINDSSYRGSLRVCRLDQ